MIMETPLPSSAQNQQDPRQTTPAPQPTQSSEEILRSLQQQLAEQNTKIDAVYTSSERMRKYFMWTLIVTVVTIVLPLIALAFLIPYYLSLMQLPAGL
jgi:ABC-type glycerol-3-phosphate transport system permease component